MAVIGKAYTVKSDLLGHFRPGDTVIALENNSCAYCIKKREYSDTDMKLAEDLRRAKLAGSELPDIPDNWYPMGDSELMEVIE